MAETDITAQTPKGLIKNASVNVFKAQRTCCRFCAPVRLHPLYSYSHIHVLLFHTAKFPLPGDMAKRYFSITTIDKTDEQTL
jgi:hypothetical protein